MNKKLFRPGEILTIRSNLYEIEKTLGEPIPGGLIDVSELKDHLLRPGEVLTYCENIKEIRGRDYRRNYPTNKPDSKLETIVGLVLLGIGAFMCLLDYVFGINLL